MIPSPCPTNPRRPFGSTKRCISLVLQQHILYWPGGHGRGQSNVKNVVLYNDIVMNWHSAMTKRKEIEENEPFCHILMAELTSRMQAVLLAEHYGCLQGTDHWSKLQTVINNGHNIKNG
jgi:hypothetical protein